MLVVISTEINAWYQLGPNRRGKKVSLNLNLSLAWRKYWWLFTAETKTWSCSWWASNCTRLGETRQTWAINIAFGKQLEVFFSCKYHERLKNLHFMMVSDFFFIDLGPENFIHWFCILLQENGEWSSQVLSQVSRVQSGENFFSYTCSVFQEHRTSQ